MKRLFLITLITVTACCSLRAQFVLMPQGFVNSNDSMLDYYVIECPGKSQEQMFRETAALLLGIYNNAAHDAVTLFPEESISVNSIAMKALITRSGIFGTSMDVRFTMQIEFRDGRLRIMSPRINEISTHRQTTREYKEKFETKDKDGKVIETQVVTREHPVTSVSYLYISDKYQYSDRRPNRSSSYIFKKNDSVRLPAAKESLEEYFNNLIYLIERDIKSDYEEW